MIINTILKLYFLIASKKGLFFATFLLPNKNKCLYLTQKENKRMITAAQKRFIDFIALEYPQYKSNILPDKVTPDMMEHFVEYLQSISKGEGATLVRPKETNQ